jgi:outer membrane lipoprotein LolB
MRTAHDGSRCAGRNGASALLAGPVLAALILAGCAAPVTRPDHAGLAAQAAREQRLRAHTHWQLSGRLAVSGDGNGGSGSLDWQQAGRGYRFVMHAPVTGRTWELRGDATHAVLEGLRDGPVTGADAASLLERELGWHVPVARLGDWVRGLRAPGTAHITFREDGLPWEIRQAGWHIEYRDYDTDIDPPMPSRIFASKDGYRVRLAVRQWMLE